MMQHAPPPHLPPAPELAEAADANFATHATWVQQRTPGMRALDGPDLVLSDCGLPCDTFNVVCRARLAAEAAPERIRAVAAYFAGVGRPFSWWVGPADRPERLGELLARAGLERAETEVAMAAELSSLRSADPAPAGLAVRRVRTGEELRAFARVTAENWSPPDRQVLDFYERAAPVLLAAAAPLRLYVGYLGEEAVATAQLTVGGGVVGLYHVSTRAEHRRRGVGSALALRPLLDARAEGHRTAVLQASRDGVGVYARLGFRPYGEITEYKPRAA